MIFIPPPVETFHIFVPDGPRHDQRRKELLDYHNSLPSDTLDAHRAEAVSLVVKYLPNIRRIFGDRHR